MELLRYFMVFCLIIYADTKKFRHYGYEYDEDVKVWLKLHRLKASWYDARDTCRREGAILASPSNTPMKDALQSYSRSYNIDQIFVGVHATYVNGWWHTIEGVPIEELMHIDISQINSDMHQCSVLNAGSLISVSCVENYPYMCYKRDNQQLTSCGTTDREYILNERIGSCYKFHTDRVTWFDAFKICSQEQAYLAIINSDDELPFIIDIFQNNIIHMMSVSNGVVNIGLIDLKGNLIFHAIHESFNNNSEVRSIPLPLYPFLNGLSKNQNKYCGAITMRGEPAAVPCSANIAFLCEKKVRNMDSFEQTIEEKRSNTNEYADDTSMPDSQNHTLLNEIIYDEYLRK